MATQTQSHIETQARDVKAGLAPPSGARHVFFVLAAFAALMGSIDATIVAVAVPQLTTALGAPLAWVAWTLTVYQLVQAVMLPLAGKLSDSFGRKRVFLFCVSTFTLGSLLCGLAPSIWVLIAARALQAIGGGGLVPSAVGVVADQYRTRRAQAIGLFTSVFPIGGIVGPNLGGFILEHWTWREMFFINVPIGLIVGVGVSLLLRETSTSTRTGRHFDVPGVALYAAAITSLLVAMTVVADDPSQIGDPLVWSGVIGSLLLAALFVRHIRRARDPVMAFDLVARQPFLAANLYNLCFGAAVFGFFSFLPTYAVLVYGMSPFLSGAVLTPRAIAMIVTSVLTSLYVIRLGYRLPMLAGMALVGVMLLLLGPGRTSVEFGPLHLEGFWLLASTLVIGGIGMGLSNPSSSNAALDLAPDRAAALTGIRSMFRLTGGVLSIAGIVVALTLFPDKGRGLATIYAWLAVPLLLAAPLALIIPDSARKRRGR